MVSLFVSAGSEVTFCSKLKSKSLKHTLLFCSENSNVFIYVENSVFFKCTSVIFNFKTHVKDLNSYFENFKISATL